MSYMSLIHLEIVLYERGTLAISLVASGLSISFTMALQTRSITVIVTVCDFFDLAKGSAMW